MPRAKGPTVRMFDNTDEVKLRNAINFGNHVEGEKDGITFKLTITNPTAENYRPYGKFFVGEYIVEYVGEDGVAQVIGHHRFTPKELVDMRKAKYYSTMFNRLVGEAVHIHLLRAAATYQDRVRKVKILEQGVEQARQYCVSAACEFNKLFADFPWARNDISLA